MSKGFLQGFSIGILLTTALLTIVIYTMNDTPTDDTAQALTEENVANYLEEGNKTAITNEELQRLTELESEIEQLRTELDEKSNNENVVEQNEETTEDTETAQETKYVFEIESGMTTPEIGQKLEKLQIITSSAELSNYLSEKGWEGSIQIGTFELSSTMSVAEIAKIITKNP